jgi:uncharacterized protein (DUF433 family)
MATLAPSLIEIDDNGRARIVGSRIKVVHIGTEFGHLGMDADAIQEAHPHLPMAKIYAAISYYLEHKEEMDAEIEAGSTEDERLRAEAIANGTQITRADLIRRAKERGIELSAEALHG